MKRLEMIRRASDELARDGMISTQSTRGTCMVPLAEPSSELQKVRNEVRRLTESLESLKSRVEGIEGR